MLNICILIYYVTNPFLYTMKFTTQQTGFQLVFTYTPTRTQRYIFKMFTAASSLVILSKESYSDFHKALHTTEELLISQFVLSPGFYTCMQSCKLTSDIQWSILKNNQVFMIWYIKIRCLEKVDIISPFGVCSLIFKLMLYK